MISAATMRAMQDVALREREAIGIFTPASVPTNVLTLSAPQDAFFAVQDARGRVLFTRDASLRVSGGVVCDGSGNAVLGFTLRGSAAAPLHVDAIDDALGTARAISIAPDGTVSYSRTTIEPRTGEGATRPVIVGRIALARFTAGTRLTQVDAAHAESPPGVVPHFGAPSEAPFGALTTFPRQPSTTGIDGGLERLQEAYVALDALRAAGRADDQLKKTAMELLK